VPQMPNDGLLSGELGAQHKVFSLYWPLASATSFQAQSA
jgi:hypothetical protein